LIFSSPLPIERAPPSSSRRHQRTKTRRRSFRESWTARPARNRPNRTSRRRNRV